MSIKQAFFSGSKISLSEDGVDKGYYQPEGRWSDGTWIHLLEKLKEEGYQLSAELSRKLDHLIDYRDRSAQIEAEHLQSCIDTASQTGLPVVISSAGYQTTAGSGRNYAVVMPDGKRRTVTSGCASSSHSTSSKWVGATEEIKAAITEYHDK